MTKITANPFITGRYVSDEFFCDRNDETAFLIKQITNGRNIALISPRRIGKTGLIHHLFNQREIADGYNTIFIDIYATSSLPEFVMMLGKAVYRQLATKRQQWHDTFVHAIRSIKFGLSYDALTGAPGIDFSVGDIKQPQTTLEEILNLLDNTDKPTIIAIDEFQQIGTYPDRNVEALLRTLMQRCKHTIFIYAGSKQHLMNNIFSTPARPFYQSVIITSLKPLNQDVYVRFAQRLFEQCGKHLQRDVVATVFQSLDGITWYVQVMMNELFALTPAGATCTADMLPTAVHNIIDVQADAFNATLASLSVKQRALLRAIASEQPATRITSADFVKRHALGSASSVQSALKPLLANDIVTHDQPTNTYYINNRFFAHWLHNE